MPYTNAEIEAAKTAFVTRYNREQTVEKAVSQSIGAAVRRARLYTPGRNHAERAPVRQRLDAYLRGLEPRYQRAVPVNEHHAQIQDLVVHMNSEGMREEFFAHPDFANVPGFRFAHAQKSISVFLKHLWCLNRIARPPECPVDRIILNEAEVPNVAWTTVGDLDTHTNLIGLIQRKAGDYHIAEWELITFRPN